MSKQKKNSILYFHLYECLTDKTVIGRICFDGNLAKNNSKDFFSFFHRSLLDGYSRRKARNPFFPKDDQPNNNALRPTSFLTLTAISFRPALVLLPPIDPLRKWLPSCCATLNFVCPQSIINFMQTI